MSTAYNGRIPIIDPQTATGEVARFYDNCTTFRGRVVNSSKVWAHIPYLAKFPLLAVITLIKEGGGAILPTKLKEMGVLKTSHVNGCAY